MATIKFTISPAPGVSNDLIAVIYKTTAPAAEVARILKPAPHPDPYNFEFNDLVVGTYVVKVHESPDGTTLGNLRHDFWIDATINKLTAYDVIEFQVDLGRDDPNYDPADGDTQYVNPNLDGLTYTVFKAGYGPLSWNANIQTITGGGFEFTDGQVFSHDEIYTILISNLVESASNAGVAPAQSYPEDIVTISGDRYIDNTFYNKLIEVTGSSNYTIYIDNWDAIPDGTKFGINTHLLQDTDPDAAFRFVTLDLPFGKYCMIFGETYNNVYVGRGEEVTFIKKGGYLRLVNWDGDYRRVGEFVYGSSKPPANSLPLTGGWYLKSDVRRLFEWHVDKLDPAELGTGTDDVSPDSSNRTKWIVGATKVWVPDRGGLFNRMTDPDGNNDSARQPGTYQADAVGPTTVKTRAFTGVGLGKNSLVNDGIGLLATHGDGGDITTDSASGTNRNSARIDAWPTISPEGQTRPKNVAVKGYVII